jgi:urease accessory protein
MCAECSQYDSPMPPDDIARAPTGWRASLALGFERRGARTVLATRRHAGPLVVQKALHPEGDSPCHAIVVHPPAGIAGGDELAIEVRAGEAAEALLTTPGAGKWYRSAGPWARQRVVLHGARGSAIEWLPQETIVFDGALAGIALEAHLEGDARLIAWDIVCLGRTGSGECFDSGRCHLHAAVFRDGRLAWRERGRIEPGSPAALSPAGLAGHPVFASVLVAAPRIEDGWLAAARAVSPREGMAAVTRLPGLLIARYRGDASEAARLYCAGIWRALREPVLGREAVEPRIWRT